ncbi:ester cyclase [Saccharopolyspora spinosa]|uniref:SnoaL-like polyketide cyclase n=1 Tax=Saccharopolyspora spinosa TaxID=60894 RepID=A0A2N3Y6B1_SACSN|nr:ester cyclase [Saccharopolyspora spinosa]PKW18438.1 SnoaL-like polyketide cyclase [Saccharopolyspora spinosa]
MQTERNKLLYRRWIEEMWHADPANMDQLAAELAAPGFVAHWPDREARGPEALAEMVRRGVSMFTDVKVAVEVGPLADGDLVSGRWVFRGSYNGELPGAPVAAGTEVVFAGIDVMRCADGKFVEYWVSSDGLEFMKQLGFTPKP